MFKHELGIEIESATTKIRGILVSRSENLYGCNRYYVQAPVSKDLKLEGWWVDEDDIKKVGKGVTAKPKPTGGPVSRIR